MDISYPLILASNSSRRQELLQLAGFDFEVIVRHVDESFPAELEPQEVPLHIAANKMTAYEDLTKDNIVICADTVVIQDSEILGKPMNKTQAFEMLQVLSGNTHQVITGVVIKGIKKNSSFIDNTTVVFEDLDEEEIHHYIDKFQPMDKAGSYGIQEWIGLIGIKEIHGSYFNVVGLPVHKVYQELKRQFS